VTVGAHRGNEILHGHPRLGAVLKVFFALHHFLCNGLDLCLRLLQRINPRGGDEMPFSLALTLELNWLSLEQRGELEVLGSQHSTPGHRAANVVDISKYLPERPLRERLVQPPPAPNWHWATTVIIVMTCLAILPYLFLTTELSPGEYSTGIGEHRTIPLSDGSQITMNTQSRLRVRFNPRGRDIELIEGEALFSVARDSIRPFRVHARHTIVEALGTQFSIYLGNSGTKIAVTRGRVRVFENLNPTPIILNPDGLLWTDTAVFEFLQPPDGLVVTAGQEARVSHEDSFTDFEVESRWVAIAELERRLAWVNGNIFFRGETLGAAVEEFNRYNWRKLKVADPAIGQLQLGGEFETTNLGGFVDALNRLYGIRATIIGDPGSRNPVIELRRRPSGPP
jgi:ferric-dicitrate binding protein FerR (iron transport regulator)